MTVCKWCGKPVGDRGVCSGCSQKHALVKKLLSMVRGKPKEAEETKETRRCAICGKEFVPFKRTQTCCSKQCWQRKRRGKPTRTDNTDLASFLREIKKYNEEHGTCLSYGQYVLMKEQEKNGKEK